MLLETTVKPLSGPDLGCRNLAHPTYYRASEPSWQIDRQRDHRLTTILIPAKRPCGRQGQTFQLPIRRPPEAIGHA